MSRPILVPIPILISLCLFCVLSLMAQTRPLPEALQNNLDEQRDFARAEELFKSGQEDKAVVSLTDFLRRYPSSLLADDAQYMLGAILFQRRNFVEAIRELKKTLNYRNRAGADRLPDAFLLVAEAWYKLGDSEKALIEWEALKRAYPGTPAAEQAQMRILEVLEARKLKGGVGR
jgi:TolA-binding protein